MTARTTTIPVYTISLGCPKNLVDSEYLLGGLPGKAKPVDRPEDAAVVLEHLLAHIGLDRHTEHMAKVIDHRLEHRARKINCQKPRAGSHDQRIIRCRQQLVDDIGDGERESQFQQAGNDGAAKIEDEEPGIRPIIGEKAPQHHVNLNQTYARDCPRNPRTYKTPLS